VNTLDDIIISDSALLTTLTAALWAAWAGFVACVLIEIAAEIRGHAPMHVAPAGPLQLLARTLVASVAMTIGSFSPLPAHTPPRSQNRPAPHRHPLLIPSASARNRRLPQPRHRRAPPPMARHHARPTPWMRPG
jgi:hypothetical protein